MALEKDRQELENRLLCMLIERSRIQFGKLHLSIKGGQLWQVADESGRRLHDAPHTPVPLEVYTQDRKVMEAAGVLAQLWLAPFSVIVLTINDGKLHHVDVRRVPRDCDPDTWPPTPPKRAVFS